ncbi:hypothetical protein SU67_05805, partial [Escherichia coli O139:H28 str. E24377A]
MLLPVIMAGGTGSRLWPMSRELYPKQFLRLFGPELHRWQEPSRLSVLNPISPTAIERLRLP